MVMNLLFELSSTTDHKYCTCNISVAVNIERGIYKYFGHQYLQLLDVGEVMKELFAKYVFQVK